MDVTLLKLRAADAEDVQVISAVLQDSIVPVCDMVFQPESNSFVVVTQRLRREAKTAAPERICCALTVKGVKKAQLHGIDQGQGERMLDLLAIMLDVETQQLSLVFAGDARIRLDLDIWACAVEDFGEPWPALCNPCHESAAIG